MFDLIKKTMLTGIGLAAMTKDKVEELAKEMKEQGKMSEKEGKELVDELLKKSERARKDLEAKVEEIVLKVLGKIDVATKKEIDILETRIKCLEEKETAEE